MQAINNENLHQVARQLRDLLKKAVEAIRLRIGIFAAIKFLELAVLGGGGV